MFTRAPDPQVLEKPLGEAPMLDLGRAPRQPALESPTVKLTVTVPPQNGAEARNGAIQISTSPRERTINFDSSQMPGLENPLKYLRIWGPDKIQLSFEKGPTKIITKPADASGLGVQPGDLESIQTQSQLATYLLERPWLRTAIKQAFFGPLTGDRSKDPKVGIELFNREVKTPPSTSQAATTSLKAGLQALFSAHPQAVITAGDVDLSNGEPTKLQRSISAQSTTGDLEKGLNLSKGVDQVRITGLNPEKLSEKFMGDSGEFDDKFGNKISYRRNGGAMDVTVSVKQGAAALSLNLTDFGSGEGDLLNLVTSRTRRPLGRIGEIPVLGDVSQGTADALLGGEMAKSIGKSIDLLNQYFRGKDGPLIKGIQISDQPEDNAQPLTDSGTIVFFRGFLQNRASDAAGITAFHEGSHILSTTFSIDRDPRFEALFKSLGGGKPADQYKPGDFLYEICEKHLLKDPRQGGHAFDGANEFFASLMAGALGVPEARWRAAVQEKEKENPGFKEQYKKALSTMRELLAEKCRDGCSEALKELDKRMTFLSKP